MKKLHHQWGAIRRITRTRAWKNLVNTLYRALLGRDADPHGLAHYTSAAIQDHLQVRDVALQLMSSIEFGRTNSELLSRLPCLMNFSEEWRVSTRKYYDAIEACGFQLNRIAQMYADAGLKEEQYTVFHLRRFYELFAYLTAHFGQSHRVPELLEIGTATHSTTFYREFFDCRYDTICRPTKTGGPTMQWASNAGSRNHWEIDLNYPERYADAVEQVPRSHYDAVVCTEVIEHLTRAPRDLIKFALSTANESGILYLTTPNFLRPANINHIFAGGSPVPPFVDYNDNFHAHHHFREYTACELMQEVTEAGGVANDVIFSNCWDNGSYIGNNEIMFRSNIVMIITRAHGRADARG